jgi:hypothetical protein
MASRKSGVGRSSCTGGAAAVPATVLEPSTRYLGPARENDTDSISSFSSDGDDDGDGVSGTAGGVTDAEAGDVMTAPREGFLLPGATPRLLPRRSSSGSRTNPMKRQASDPFEGSVYHGANEVPMAPSLVSPSLMTWRYVKDLVQKVRVLRHFPDSM